MTTKVRMWIAGFALATLIGLATMSSASNTVGEKDLTAVVVKIADAIKKGDKDGAKKLVAAAVKDKALIEEMGDIMHMFKLRKSKGVGIGPNPLANPAKDGIEIKMRELGRDVPAGIAKEAEALEATGYYIAAIAELSTAYGWQERDSGKRTKKAWKESSEELAKLGVEFAKAAAGKAPGSIQKAAAKLNENCNRCHTAFKNN